LSDSQDDPGVTVKEDESDLTEISTENARLRTLVKRYRHRLEGVKKALNSDENDTEQKRLSDNISALLQVIKSKNPDIKFDPDTTLLLNGQPIDPDMAIIKTTKEEYDKLQNELSLLKKSNEELKSDNLVLNQEKQQLKKEAESWQHQNDQQVDIQKTLQQEIALERMERDIAVKKLDDKLQAKDEEMEFIKCDLKQKWEESEKIWKLKEKTWKDLKSKLDQEKSRWDSLENSLKSKFEQEKTSLIENHKNTVHELLSFNQTFSMELDQLKGENSDLKKQMEDSQLKFLAEKASDKEQITKLSRSLKHFLQEMQQMKEDKLKGRRHDNPNPSPPRH
jgi:chromosome segregation ATPase